MLSKYLLIIAFLGLIAAALATIIARDIGVFMLIAPVFLILAFAVYLAKVMK